MFNVMQYAGSEGAYLKAADLPQGANVEVTIAGLEGVEFENDGKKQTKLVLSFVGKDKKLSLNKTNLLAITEMYGEDGDTWIGKKIYVYRTKTDFGGNMVDCVRVDVPRQVVREQPAQQQSTQQPPAQTGERSTQQTPPDFDNFDDDIPF